MWKLVLAGLAVAAGLGIFVVWNASHRFDRQVDRRIEAMLDAGRSEGRVVTDADLADLPEPIARWLRHAGVVGKPIPTTVRLRQRGRIRQSPESPWMSFRADQYYTIDPPGFVWRVSASIPPGIPVRGFDALDDGRGTMQMKPLALFSVVDASGPTIDQGAALRYLQETVWFPFAALSPSIVWNPIDASRARATLSIGSDEVSGVVHVDDAGRVTLFEALRYRDEAPAPALRPWQAVTREDRELSGIRVPTAGEGVWALDDGPFVYVELEILELEYDVPAVYPR